MDPLTCDWIALRLKMRDGLPGNAWDVDCDCGNSPFAEHHSLCSITPIYADLVREVGRPQMTSVLLMARAAVWRAQDRVAR